MSEPLLDTNVFVHAQTRDAFSEECKALLRGLERGDLSARLEPFVLHELSYALPRYVKHLTRADIGDYLLSILHWPGIRCDKALLIEAVRHWVHYPGLGFVDALLVATALQDGSSVLTKNRKHVAAFGVDAPDPLPGVKE